MVDRRFCDWCGKDITDKPQRLLNMKAKMKRSDDFMEWFEEQLCEPCGVDAELALNGLKEKKRALAGLEAVRGNQNE
jgi:hypothetical protein